MKVLFATPTGRSVIQACAYRSIMHTVVSMTKAGIETDVSTVDLADVMRARNVLASDFLTRKDFTHLAFVDADMSFSAGMFQRMLAYDKPLIAVAAPKRTFNSKNINRTIGELIKYENKIDVRRAIGLSDSFNVALDGQVRDLNPDDGFVEVKALGTGLMLIRREVFDAMLQAGEAKATTLKGYGYPVYGFFNCIMYEDSGDYISEDLSFCMRWRNCGGTVYALVDETIGHEGNLLVEASFADRIRRARNKKRPAT
ncbi:MAG: hypothetical protein AAF414_08530 [Pseudomonadota bacterium]